MMRSTILNKQAMCQRPWQCMKTKCIKEKSVEKKNSLRKQATLNNAANSIKQASIICNIVYIEH